MLLALLLAQVLPANPEGPIFTNPATMWAPAFFEAFPANGRGTTTACSTTPPTGAKGEALSFARTGNATCTATASGGLATTGIANGDLVVMSANQPRVEYDSAGVLGLLVESARTNSALRSQEFDNAAWTKGALTSAVPTVTANFATAPDGTTTAERVQFDSCSAVNTYSVVYQLALVATGAASPSVFCRSNTGSAQTISVCTNDSDASSHCSAVTCPVGSWARVSDSHTVGGANGGIVIGCDNEAAYAGSSNTGTADVLLWGAQVEAGAYATSYIPTTSAAVARNAETATMPVAVSQLPISIAWSSAQTLPQGGASNDRIGVMTRELSGSGNFVVSYFQAQFRSDAVGSASGSALNGGTSAAGDRWATSHDTGGVLTSFKNGTQTATNTTAKTMNAATVVGIGASPAGLSHLDGIVSRVCVDPSPTRCR